MYMMHKFSPLSFLLLKKPEEKTVFIMTKLSMMAFASATAEMSVAKGRTLLLSYSVIILFCHLCFLNGLFLLLYSFSVSRPLSQYRRMFFYVSQGSLPPTLPVFLLSPYHCFCHYFLIPPSFSRPLYLSEVMVNRISLPC